MQAAYKLLRTAEVGDRGRYHQRELNGVAKLKELLGTERTELELSLVLMGDAMERETCSATWYDSRANQPNRTEHRLYLSSNLLGQAQPGWLFVLLGNVAIVANPSYASWLVEVLGLSDLADTFRLSPIQLVMPPALRIVLSEAGVDLPESGDSRILEALLERFDGRFPTTAAFSAYARETCPLSPSTPDEKLVAWTDHEWHLFSVLERHQLAERLAGVTDVDRVFAITQSMRNRRFSRAGKALENHIERLLTDEGVNFTREGYTELRIQPDFLFPSERDYHDPCFPAALLTMLGAKTSLRDRWRQVLSEAARIPNKHLVTLQPRLTETQAREVASANLTIVSPMGMPNAMSVAGFVDLVKHRQLRAQSFRQGAPF